MKKSMYLISTNSSSPSFNLAAEEYLLSHIKDGEVFILWVNSPSVIVGKFQNPFEEVSLLECEKKGVGIYRRNSGGGTVYHDHGNLNYTVIAEKSSNFPDYGRFLTPIVSALTALGVSAKIGDTSALYIGDEKISGNAQSVVGERIMHHGTLLFDVDLTALTKLTGNARAKVASKSIKSKPSPVTNIKDHLGEEFSSLTLSSFAEHIRSFLCPDAVFRSLTPDEEAEIKKSESEKYGTWEWNMGKSPAFTLTSDSLTLESSRGVIKSVLSSDHTSSDLLSELLVGERLIPARLREKLSSAFGEEEADKLITDIFS